MRLALITNRASGADTDPGAIAALLGRSGATVDVYDVAAGDAALERAPDRLVVAGGDGSLGPYAALAAARGLPLAVIPTGTANDFARALGLPPELGAAARLAADPGAPTRSIEVLRAGDRPFLNAAAAGLSVRAAERAGGLKGLLGPLAYAAGALRAGLGARPLRCTVRLDGAELFHGGAWQVIVAGTGAFGGGSRVDAADPQDGLLDVTVLAAGRRAVLVRHAYAMRNGGLTGQAGVHHARGRAVELDVAEPVFNVDGELLTVSPPRFTTRGERADVVVAY
ncbi:MAG: diacylglycerol/lipid kinase family protein [Solirubrobacteraceae bacterium]